jgi:hypothetical protein
MRHLSTLLMLCCSPLFPQGRVTAVLGSESRTAIRAFTPSGEAVLPAIHLRLELDPPIRSGGLIDVVVVYDPQSSHYFWAYTPAANAADKASYLNDLQSGTEGVYAGPAALVNFISLGATFEIQEHRNRASSLDAAEKAAIDQISRQMPKPNDGYEAGFKVVNIAREVGSDFACEPNPPRANCGFDIGRIASISRDADNWHLVIRNRWDQEIILDSNFKFVSTKRLSEPVSGGQHQ